MKHKGIILAAGRGSRMKSLTDEHPKCMVRLDGKMLLEWQEAALRNADVEDLVVIGGYNIDKFPSSFKTLCNERWYETNMVSTLMVADDILLHNTTIVSYSDIVYSSAHVQKLIASKGDICITYDSLWYELWSKRFENPLLDAETFVAKDNMLHSIGSKTTSIEDIQGQYMGLLKFTPKGWKQTKEVLDTMEPEATDKLDMTSLLSMLLQHNIPIDAVEVQGKWCEVDSDEDLNLYIQLMRGDWVHNWKDNSEES